ncbi:hypothetical protein GCM10010398_71370 [Streptomyces fimbriatus]
MGTAAAIDDRRFGLQWALQRLRQDFDLAALRSTGAGPPGARSLPVPAPKGFPVASPEPFRDIAGQHVPRGGGPRAAAARAGPRTVRKKLRREANPFRASPSLIRVPAERADRTGRKHQ